MPVKPSEVPTWATDTNYTGGAEAGTPTKVDPGASRKAEGWEPAAKPPAQEFNFWWNLVGQWLSYVNRPVDTYWIDAVDFREEGATNSPGAPELDQGIWLTSTTGGISVLVAKVPLPAGTRITSITAYGASGNTEAFWMTLIQKTSTGARTPILEKESATVSGNTSVVFDTSDPEFAPDGYELTDNSYWLQIQLEQATTANEVKFYNVKIVTG